VSGFGLDSCISFDAFCIPLRLAVVLFSLAPRYKLERRCRRQIQRHCSPKTERKLRASLRSLSCWNCGALSLSLSLLASRSLLWAAACCTCAEFCLAIGRCCCALVVVVLVGSPWVKHFVTSDKNVRVRGSQQMGNFHFKEVLSAKCKNLNP